MNFLCLIQPFSSLPLRLGTFGLCRLSRNIPGSHVSLFLQGLGWEKCKEGEKNLGLSSPYHIASTVHCSLRRFSHFLFIRKLGNWHNYFHLADKDTEVGSVKLLTWGHMVRKWSRTGHRLFHPKAQVLSLYLASTCFSFLYSGCRD